jgi:hypothetical protein
MSRQRHRSAVSAAVPVPIGIVADFLANVSNRST